MVREAKLWLAAARCAGLRYRCPVCGWRLRRMTGARGGVCPRCWSPERTRLLWLYIDRELDVSGCRVLHVAPELGLSRRLKAAASGYVAIDLEGLNDAFIADLTALPFDDDSFDMVVCSHVLEHIPEDRQAMSEMRRVLRPGGTALMQHPIAADTTFEDPAVDTPAERERVYGQSDHVRIYGRDLFDRLAAAGFAVTEVDYRDRISPNERETYRLEGAEPIHVCR